MLKMNKNIDCKSLDKAEVFFSYVACRKNDSIGMVVMVRNISQKRFCHHNPWIHLCGNDLNNLEKRNMEDHYKQYQGRSNEYLY